MTSSVDHDVIKLKNIFSGESKTKLLRYLSNRNAVEKSKQMPFQFYNAFNALTELEESFNEFFEGQVQKSEVLNKKVEFEKPITRT